jgi:hypothetical protein
MKNLIFATFFVAYLQMSAFAQCATEPTPSDVGKILKTENLTLAESCNRSACEVSLTVVASASGVSWEQRGAQAAALTIFVDGKYNQDLFLFAGAEKFSYRIALGKLAAGKHEIAVAHNKARSAVGKSIEIYSILPGVFSLADIPKPTNQTAASREDFADENLRETALARKHAPFIYARPNAVDKFTDIPLLLYYEIFDEHDSAVKRIRYTAVFSHEDGGTEARALMARWGRMTDIEWIYEIKIKNGKIAGEIYQGANHETKNFTGKRAWGNHPLIFTVTDNNNFADNGCSALRFAPLPVRADLTNGSRETLMERYPWIYRVMAKEIERENRVNPVRLDADVIDDPRNYLYVETFAENNGSAISISVADPNGKTGASDWNDARLRVNRSGFFRIAVRIPENISRHATIALHCFATAAQNVGERNCRNARIVRTIRLNDNFEPSEIKFEDRPATNLKPNENLLYKIEF